MSAETILTNARLVLPEEVRHGTIVLRDGRIADVQPGVSALPGAEDCGEDHLIPGLVDLHTDNLERQVEPRAHARWPSRSAMLAHDAQTAAAGTTTVLDALCLGDLGFDTARIETFRNGVADLDALAHTGLFKSEHWLHLRCELPAADMPSLFDSVADHPRLRMVSLMDHSPGVGQYADLERYRKMRARSGMPAAEIERRIAALLDQRGRLRAPQRRWLLDRVAGKPVALASHDDWHADEIAENAADGIRISEFPVSLAAARAARAQGMTTIGGAPNLVRGGSHSGNVAVADLAREKLLDCFASDYVPPALLEAAFRTAEAGYATLPEAIAMVTEHPARMVGLADRGALAPGLRADLVRVRLFEGTPVVRQVWLAGERVI
jgi:alpha-D-ribose 1-methylphosphonate 5-triphosphate diphosphatase